MDYCLQFVRFIAICVSMSMTVVGKCTARSGDPVNLTSVFNSFHLSSLYEAARKRTSASINSRSPPCTDAIVADAICQKVTSSAYFRNKNYRPVDMVKVYPELLDKERETIRNDMFVKLSNAELSSLFATDDHYAYQNPYYEINKDVVIRETRQPDFRVESEYVFTCLVRHCESGELETFYISREYNTANHQKHSLGPRTTTGRFIFQGDRRKELTLVALAEEPAEVFYGNPSDQIALERAYIKMKKSSSSTDETENKRVVCGRVERSRLCSSILEGMRSSTPEYRDRLTPLEYYEPVECFEKEVSFWTDEVRNEIGESEKYREWMIYCEARDSGDEDYPIALVRFFVSAAWNPDHVFVYFVLAEGGEASQSLSDGKAYLENLCGNISINVYD